MSALQELRHIIVLMLENQSFDRLLGYLTLDDQRERLEGLTGSETNAAAPPTDMTPVAVTRVTDPDAYIVDPSPGHEFDDVNQQLFCDRAPRDTRTPQNAGFVLNYSEQRDAAGRALGVRGREVMRCLDPTLVPVLATLARNFTICDHWFASVPGPTWPNRFFLHAATAKGFLSTPETPGQFASQFVTSPYDMPTIFENLMDHGLTWAVYFDDYAQAFALRSLHPLGERFLRFEQFAQDVERGTLPTYAFIEPRSFSAPGFPANDQHPPHHLLEGERLIADVYDTLRANDAVWRRSLTVILYDEHGGFYDHVPPPPAVPPDVHHSQPSGFGFDRLGARVPAILVSPWVPQGHADHTVYDHTSVPATLKKIFGLPRFLTARDAAAHTFDHNFLTEARTVRLMDLASVIARPNPAEPARPSGPLSAHQRSLLALAQFFREAADATRGTDIAQRHARSFLDQPQAP